jgi:hypothetical protein
MLPVAIIRAPLTGFSIRVRRICGHDIESISTGQDSEGRKYDFWLLVIGYWLLGA